MWIAMLYHHCLRTNPARPLRACAPKESFSTAPGIEIPANLMEGSPEMPPSIHKSRRETLFQNFNVPISSQKAPITACKSEQYPHISVFDYFNSYFAFVVFRSSPQTIGEFKV
jgi:hypothetical protein